MSHFKFGENWKNFSSLIDKERLIEAEKSLIKLTDKKKLTNLSFLDIGCGSGLSSLAALKLNCKKIYSIDQDKDSIETTKKVLRLSGKKNFKIEKKDLFDLSEKEKFDIVYSWGVLHHTGKMYDAIIKSTKMLKHNGVLILALYKKTKLCSLWKIEKLFYKSAPRIIQNFLKFIFINLFRLAMFIKGKSFSNYLKNYKKKRGMDFFHDVHDWLGGYPYESISFEEMQKFMKKNNFKMIRSFQVKKQLGLFGTGCDEYVFTKRQVK